MARLDTQQRRLLELLSETEWRSTETVFAGTSLFRSHASVSSVLGRLVIRGLVERRVTGNHRQRLTEWRLVANGEQEES